MKRSRTGWRRRRSRTRWGSRIPKKPAPVEGQPAVCLCPGSIAESQAEAGEQEECGHLQGTVDVDGAVGHVAQVVEGLQDE